MNAKIRVVSDNGFPNSNAGTTPGLDGLRRHPRDKDYTRRRKRGTTKKELPQWVLGRVLVVLSGRRFVVLTDESAVRIERSRRYTVGVFAAPKRCEIGIAT